MAKKVVGSDDTSVLARFGCKLEAYYEIAKSALSLCKMRQADLFS